MFTKLKRAKIKFYFRTFLFLQQINTRYSLSELTEGRTYILYKVLRYNMIALLL
jgi:hypothetical protein